MDARAQAVFRQLKANPGDEGLREHAEAIIARWHCDPAARFQGDLAHKGRLERALVWEMEFSRISIQSMPGGGMVSCGSKYGNLDVHVRVWYPEMQDLLEDFILDDVRMVVQATGRRLGDTLESLADNFPGATVVSANVARAQPDGWERGMQKPLRGDRIDPKALTMDDEAAVLARPGRSSWVA